MNPILFQFFSENAKMEFVNIKTHYELLGLEIMERLGISGFDNYEDDDYFCGTYARPNGRFVRVRVDPFQISFRAVSRR
uniref:DUF2156 domain-containing protein n=1 Tax=Caenorhabditis tropicalis TaxID=1561998 RepID=A0A1I7UI71_9PELO